MLHMHYCDQVQNSAVDLPCKMGFNLMQDFVVGITSCM